MNLELLGRHHLFSYVIIITKILSQQAVPRKVRDLSLSQWSLTQLPFDMQRQRAKGCNYLNTCSFSLSSSGGAQVHVKCCNRNICVHFQSVSLLSNNICAPLRARWCRSLGHCIALPLKLNYNCTCLRGMSTGAHVCTKHRFSATDELLLNEIKSLLRLRPVSCIAMLVCRRRPERMT